MTPPTLAPSHVLPVGWRWVRLGEVCEDVTGVRDPQRKPDEQFRYVDISSVDNKAKRIVEAKTLSGHDAPSRARQVIRSGDVIISTTRPNLNAIAVVPDELHDEICSTGFCVLRAKGSLLDGGFLFWFGQSSRFVDALSDLVKGALYPAVTDKQVRDQLIPLPPLAEQRRIAARLSQQMAHVARARAAAEERLAAAQRLPRAFIERVLASASSTERVLLGELCTIDAPIIDPKLPEYRDLPHVNGENIESGSGRILYLQTSAQLKMTSGKYLFDAGVVLYSKLRPYLRKAAIGDFRGVCSADMYPIKVDAPRLNPAFLLRILLSDEFTDYANEESRRARMPKLNREQLLSWRMPLPTLSEQESVLEAAQEAATRSQRIVEMLQHEFEGIAAVPSSLLSSAFGAGVMNGQE